MNLDVEQLSVQLETDEQTDAQDRAMLMEHLRQMLLELEVESVFPVGSTSAPLGAKGDISAFSALAVSLTPIVVNQLMKALQAWVAQRGNASVTVVSGDDKIILKGPLSKEKHLAIKEFISRHDK